jgi:iron-sulfur cluster assembly accessory protein
MGESTHSDPGAAFETAAPFSLTEKAARHIRKTMERDGVTNHGLRIAVVPGGCSGYEYAISFASAPETGDLVLDIESLPVFVDKNSVDKLAGTVLDYVDGLYGAGLKFTNPKAVHTCGCGTSFSTE